MKTKSILIFILLLFCSAVYAGPGTLNIVPVPMEMKENKGFFKITVATKILYDNSNEFRDLANLLADKIKITSGIEVKTGTYSPSSLAKNNIILTKSIANEKLGSEGYILDISKYSVFLRATDASGIFYGLQTLFQVFPIQPEFQKPKSPLLSLPALYIQDMPRYAYRGLHLDVCRHIFPMEFIKKYIDLMAMYKLNTFHWHLTDDQGWRIEIKKYPKLTQISSMRNGTQIGRTDKVDDVPYGGYYTQDQAREIVAYAASRHITVIPEIEMPGHGVAALSAYPALSCTGGPFEVRKIWGISDDIFCAGNDSTFIFLQDILDKVMEIFPSNYIHVGGDEAPKVRWKQCPKCQQRIKNEGLANEMELQSYFVKRIEKYLVSKGRKLIGWDEILEGGLAPEATVMAWRGLQAGIDAATQNHDAIMTPTSYCYFDYYQGDPAMEPEGIGGRVTLKTVYSFNPTPPVLTPEQAKHIIGVQGNVWTEYVNTPELVEFKAFPRAIALAEVAWSQQERRNWDDFINRMDKQYLILKAMNVNYSKGSMQVSFASQYDQKKEQNIINITSETANDVIRYTTDGQEPTMQSKIFKKPFSVNKTTVVKAALFKDGKRIGPINSKEFIVSIAYGKPVSIIKPYSFKYTAGGDQAMTDGLQGGPTFKDGWQGYEKADMEFMVDLKASMPLHSISINFLADPGSWVLFPKNMTFEISDDNINWKPVLSQTFADSDKGWKVEKVSVSLQNEQGRYVRVKAESPKVLPAWHEYKGEPCWIFADELVVQ